MDEKSINFIPRERVNGKIESKSALLKQVIRKLQKGEKALEISFKNHSELTYIRSIAYDYNKKSGEVIKSIRDPDRKVVYLYK